MQTNLRRFYPEEFCTTFKPFNMDLNTAAKLALGVIMAVAGNDLINKGLNQVGYKRRHN